MPQPRPVYAVIPACGRATRLAPYPGPKELFPIGWQEWEIAGRIELRPKVVSQYLVEALQLARPDTIFMVVGRGKQDLLAYFSPPQFTANIAAIYREATASMPHTIDAAYTWTQNATVLFGMPDTIVAPQDAFVQLLAAHQARNADLTLGLFYTEQPSRFGMVEMSAEGRIVRHVDKPRDTTMRMMWGIAVWEPAFTALLHQLLAQTEASTRETVLGDAFDKAIATGLAVHGVLFDKGTYLDIGSVDGIKRASSFLESR